MNNYLEKQFVPYEQALQLKELGFNEPCFAYYYTLNGIDWGLSESYEYFGLDDEISIWEKFNIPAPLYQQVFDWFNEEHGMYSYIETFENAEGKLVYDWSIQSCKYEETKHIPEIKPQHDIQLSRISVLNELIKEIKNEPNTK